MSKPVIFTISATWDDEASAWSGHCDDIPAAADAPTLDELLAKISAMALDLLPDNHPQIDPASLFLQITPLREGEICSSVFCAGTPPMHFCDTRACRAGAELLTRDPRWLRPIKYLPDRSRKHT